jgi:mono/diheme cytochrome c family protein
VRRLQRLALVIAASFGALAVHADEPPAANKPDERALAARAVLATYCYRCHGENGAAEGGFNSATDRDRLVAKKRIIPGNPDKSLVIRRVSEGEMPPPEEKARPTAAEIETLKKWVKAGAADWGQVTTRRFISLEEEIKFLSEDRTKYTADRFGRYPVGYLTLTPLYNAGATDDELQTVRDALAKLLNSLSWEPALARPEPLNPEKTIYRIDLKAIGMEPFKWGKLAEASPYAAAYQPDKKGPKAEFAVRADWFVAEASRPPNYHLLARIPDTVPKLEAQLKVAAADDIKAGKVIRSGFTRSGVSLHNRMIERHQGPGGYYWKSYDFAQSKGRKNLLAFPLGPGPSAERETFQPDGGEIIFRLPNGLQGYMLADGRGNRLDRGPTNVVSDPKHPEKVVENGVSCMSCHAAGFIDKADQIRPLAESDVSPFSSSVRATVLRLYPPREDFQKALKADAAEYQSALDKLGIRPGRPDPVSATTRGYLTEVDLRLAAAEAWLRPDEARAALKTRPKIRGDGLEGLLLTGGTIQRDTFETWFRVLLYHGHKGEVELPRPDTKHPRPKATREVEVVKGDAARLGDVELDIGTKGKTARPLDVDPTFQTVAVVSAEDSNRLLLFDLKTGKLRHKLDDAADLWIERWTFSPDGTIIAVGTPRLIRFVDVATGKEKGRTRKVPTNTSFSYGAIAFSPDGTELATNSPEGGILFLTPGKDRARPGIKETSAHFAALVYSPDGRYLLSPERGDFGRVRITDARSGEKKWLTAADSGTAVSVACSPNGKLIAVTYSKNTVKLFDAETRDEVGLERVTFRGQTTKWPATHTAVFSRDSKYLAVAHAEGILTLWSTDTMRLLTAVDAGDGNRVWSVQFSPDGKRVATGTSGNRVRLWDVEALAKSSE